MFENGAKESEEEEKEEKDEKFLEHGFGIKRLFGRVAKAKNRLEDSVGSFSIDLADSDSALTENSDSEKLSGSESGETNRIEKRFNMTESNDFEHGQNDHGEIGQSEIGQSEIGQSDVGQTEEQSEHGSYEHRENGSHHVEAVPEPPSGFETEAHDIRPEHQEAFSAREQTEESLDSEEFDHTETESFEAEPDSPHMQLDEVNQNGFENREVVLSEESSDVNEFKAPAEFGFNGNNHAVTVLDDTEESIVQEKPEPTLYEEADVLTKSDLRGVKTPAKFLKKLKKKNLAVKSITKILQEKEEEIKYEKELRGLQLELIKIQNWVRSEKKRVVILFEGLDSIGNRNVIRSFVEYLDPRVTRVVALPKPTKDERGQLYFHRYANNLPRKGEIVMFDRSWYDRAIMEPVNNVCTAEQYGHFLRHAPDFEHMLFEDGTHLVKFWFSVSKKELVKRIKNRKKNPLLSANLNAIDSKVKKRWTDYKNYRELMFSRTHFVINPWTIVKANDEKAASLESIKYFVAQFDYEGKDTKGLKANSRIVFNCERPAVDIA